LALKQRSDLVGRTLYRINGIGYRHAVSLNGSVKTLTLKEMEKQYIAEVLDLHGGRATQAAKIREFGLSGAKQ
jgi:hypothetical protein